ncbi:histidine kinase [Novosphingobium sp. TH158]|nr:histidine kinase [Novosphingobium sp. TH158]
MQFDDRLATVLRVRAGSDAIARTQFRQLIDLLGTLPVSARGAEVDAAWVRLAELSKVIPSEDRAAVLSESGLRLRSARLVAELARTDLRVAEAALAAAQLGEDEWLDLVPALPPQARLLLRRRADLGERVDTMLERLGIARQSLPPAGSAARHPANDTHGERLPEPREGIGAIVQRIEAYRKRRAELVEHGAPAPVRSEAPLLSTAFACDERGFVTWAEPAAAPGLTGIHLISRDGTSAAACAPGVADAFRRRVPIRGEAVTVSGAPAISGEWQMDAYPRFDAYGRFTGYEGRLRRACPPDLVPAVPQHGEADRLRQLLHELRTPVNAIQGFAEVIQQQLFGPTPHEYRAHAAAIAGDAARMLAGFDDLERLAKLTTGAMQLEPGECDLGEVALVIAQHLEPHTATRDCGFALGEEAPALPVDLAREEAERLTWRMMATLAAAAAPGERLALGLQKHGQSAILTIALPKSLADQTDVFHAAASQGSTPISAGMFGSGFALRLAASEARAAGGRLERLGNLLRLELPLALDGIGEPDNTESKGIAV